MSSFGSFAKKAYTPSAQPVPGQTPAQPTAAPQQDPQSSPTSQVIPNLPKFGKAPPKELEKPITGAAANDSGSNLDPEIDKLYKDIYSEHQKSWGDTEKMIGAQTAMNQRRASEINASMGRSIGGGFAGMAAQAQLNGQMQMTGARQTHADRGRQLQLGYMDRQITEKHRLEDLERDAVPTGSMEDPMPLSALPYGAGNSGSFKSRNADGTVTILMDDGKYYSVSAEEYKSRWPSGLPGEKTGSGAMGRGGWMESGH